MCNACVFILLLREARTKEKAERDAIAGKIIEEHLIKMIGINTGYSTIDMGDVKLFPELELELGPELDLDFEGGMNLKEFRDRGLNIEEFMMCQWHSEDSDYGTSGQPLKKKPKVSGSDSDKPKRKSKRKPELGTGLELDFEDGINLKEFRNSGLNIEEFLMCQRHSEDSDYVVGTSGQSIKKKPKVSGSDSDKLKRKSKRKIIEETESFVEDEVNANEGTFVIFSSEADTTFAIMDRKYIITETESEVTYLFNYILGGQMHGFLTSKEEFLERFASCVSSGFDPDTDLVQICILVQQYQYFGELVEKVMIHKYGRENLEAHVKLLNTPDVVHVTLYEVFM